MTDGHSKVKVGIGSEESAALTADTIARTEKQRQQIRMKGEGGTE